MCGRYYVDPDDPKIKKIVQAALEKKQKEYQQLSFKGGDIYPGSVVPVITASGPVFMKWAFPASFPGAKDHINIRSETANKLKSFKASWQNKRCLIPASAYYEWQKLENKKIAYIFHLENQSLFYLAALYSEENQGFAIVTRESTSQFSFIHPRMPVIIAPALLDDWLFTSPSVVTEAVTVLSCKKL